MRRRRLFTSALQLCISGAFMIFAFASEFVRLCFVFVELTYSLSLEERLMTLLHRMNKLKKSTILSALC